MCWRVLIRIPIYLLLGNRVYTSCIYVMNKIDQISIEELDLIYKVPHAGKTSGSLVINL
jgi:ribosome-interacting GTPase 1